MSVSFRLAIVSPKGDHVQDQVTAVTVPGADGSFGVLADHAPCVVLLKEGAIKISKAEGELVYKIRSGVMEVRQGGETQILVDELRPADVPDD